MKAPRSNKKRVLIVDDHPMMRQGLAQLINNETDLIVAAEADTAEQALKLVHAALPDLVLADIGLPEKNGLELIKDLKVSHPDLPILVVSMHDETLYAERVLRAGGRGYIMKQEGGKVLLDAIRQVLAGQTYVSQKMTAKIVEVFAGRRAGTKRSEVQNLSDREFEVFRLIGEGKTTRAIGEHLHISVKTVEVHRANIKRKLNLAGATDLVHAAIRWVEKME
jgi:DNA-binding NarL/FixJ family response regulator